MAGIEDELYRETILEHFKNPRNKGILEDPDIRSAGANPLCGDEIEVTVKLAQGRLEAVKINPSGCAISQASASMMTDSLKGKSIEEIKADIALFRGKMLEGKNGDWPDSMSDLESLEGVKKYPSRVKCAVLAWNTLAEGLKDFESHGSKERVTSRHTEDT